jgi:hypothetical protein
MSETPSAFEKSCPQCGGKVDSDARFCKYCAFDLIQPSLEPHTTVGTNQVDRGKNPKATLLIGILVIGLLLGLGTFLYLRNRAQSQAVTSPAPSPTPSMGDRAKQVEEKILRGDTLSGDDISGLSAHELRVLRNLHFARYGRKYDQAGELGGYFYTRPWYKPSDSYNESMITATDKANVNLIVASEKLAVANEGNSNTPVVTVSTPIPAPQSTTDQSDSGILTNEKVQRALDKFASQQRGTMRLKGGIHEIPSQNTAKAQCTHSGIHYTGRDRSDLLMPSDANCYIDFTKYTDGRWVITKIYLGYDSGGREWTPNIVVN